MKNPDQTPNPTLPFFKTRALRNKILFFVNEGFQNMSSHLNSSEDNGLTIRRSVKTRASKANKHKAVHWGLSARALAKHELEGQGLGSGGVKARALKTIGKPHGLNTGAINRRAFYRGFKARTLTWNTIDDHVWVTIRDLLNNRLHHRTSGYSGAPPSQNPQYP